MRKPIDRLPADLAKRIDLSIRHVTFGILRAVKLESPVGNPGLWASNAGRAKKRWRRPEGYVGGQFRRSWHAVYYSALRLGIVFNPMPYAGVLAENVSPSGKAPHSRQIPMGWIRQRLPDLLRELASQARVRYILGPGA